MAGVKKPNPMIFQHALNLAQANKDALSSYKTIDSIDILFNSLQTDRTDNQIWKWFVIFALLFLVTEMAIIRFVK